jgi:hypothetical protein
MLASTESITSLIAGSWDHELLSRILAGARGMVMADGIGGVKPLRPVIHLFPGCMPRRVEGRARCAIGVAGGVSISRTETRHQRSAETILWRRLGLVFAVLIPAGLGGTCQSLEAGGEDCRPRPSRSSLG